MTTIRSTSSGAGAPNPSDAPDGGPSPAWSAVRVARPVRDLARSRRFYCDGLGLPPVGGFADHDGYDGLFVGLPGGGELELTRGPEQPVTSAEDDLLVLYVRTWHELDVVARRLADAGIRTVPAANPYWNRWGRTFLDPDGYRVVVAIPSVDDPHEPSDR